MFDLFLNSGPCFQTMVKVGLQLKAFLENVTGVVAEGEDFRLGWKAGCVHLKGSSIKITNLFHLKRLNILCLRPLKE